MKLSLAFSLFLVLSSAMMISGEDLPHACICNYACIPVCGKDGITYANMCIMECEGIELAHPGECVKDKENRRSCVS